ncbi:hypothetical protein AMTRI_Chr03g54730 [Amborella trichopoda]
MFKNLDWWFDSHLWVTDGGKIEAKYTSRAAELYRQLFSKEVNQTVNGLSHVDATGTSKENEVADKLEASEHTASPKVPSHPVTSTLKKPFGARKGSKTGGLGAQKLTTKVESTGSSTNASATPSIGSSFPSRFEYVESMQSAEPNSGGTQLLNHVSPLKSSSFYVVLEWIVESRKCQETNEAQLKFSNAKSISSTQFFGDQNKASDASSQISFSTSISIADLFGHNTDDPSLDLSATDLMNRISILVLLHLPNSSR